MNALISKTIGTRYGEKDISVYAQDIVDIREPIDVMTVSAFLHGYNPSPDTLMGALYGRGIDVRELAASPQIASPQISGFRGKSPGHSCRSAGSAVSR